MSRLINPWIQFLDEDGNPYAAGTVYFGLPNQDPVANPKAPYSDAALTVAIGESQVLDDKGMFSTAVYLKQGYSMSLFDVLGNPIRTEPEIYGSVTAQDEFTITKATIAAAKADDDLANFVGGFVRVAEYTAGNPIDALYEIIAGAGVQDGVEIHNSDTASLFNLKLVIDGGAINVSVGGVNSSAADIGGQLQNVITVAETRNLKVVFDLDADCTMLTAVTFTKALAVEVTGDYVISCTGNITFFKVELTFPPTFKDMDFGGLRIEHSGVYNGVNQGTGILFTNLVRSKISGLSSEYFTQCIAFQGEFFNNVFERVRSAEGKVGWDGGSSTDNNNNTFVNCRLSGTIRGSLWGPSANDQTFVGCDFSAVNEDHGSVPLGILHEWTDAVSVKFFGGYIEGAATYILNGFKFSTVTSTNGQVVFDGFWFKGSSSRLGTAVQSTNNVNVTMVNPWFNGYDIGFQPQGAGHHSIINLKSSVINLPVDTSLLGAGTGTITEQISGKTIFQDSTGDTGRIGIGSAGTEILLNGSTRVYSNDGDPVDGDATGSLYTRKNATIDRANGLHCRIGGAWFDYRPFLRGTTANRPNDANLFSSDIGLQYFDTTLNMPVYYVSSGSATKWKDAAGNDA